MPLSLIQKATTKVLILTDVKGFARTSDYEQPEDDEGKAFDNDTDWNECCILSI